MNAQMKVGVFLGIGLITVVLSIFFLGSSESLFQKSIKVHTYFDNTQGLNTGGVVSLAGVKIGNIDKIEYDETKKLVKVYFLVNQSHISKIKTDSVVDIRTQGALGDKYLYISPGSSSEIISNNFEMKSDYGSDFLSIVSKRSSDTEKIFDTINEMQILMKSINHDQKIPSIISKMNAAAGNLQQVSEHIKMATADNQAQKAVTRVNSILEKIDKGEGTLGALINDKAVHNRIKNLLGAGEKQKQLKNTLESSIQ